MRHKHLTAYIEERLKAGMPREQIKKTLLSAGWAAEDIKEAFYYISSGQASKRFSLRKILYSKVPASFAILLPVAAALGIFIFSGKQTLSYTINLPAGAPAEEKIKFSYGEQKALSDP